MESMRSPQSPGVSTVAKLRAMALLQHVAIVVDVVLEVEVLEVVVARSVVDDVDVVEVLEVVVARRVVDVVELVEVLDVVVPRTVVDVVELVEVLDVVLTRTVVDVVDDVLEVVVGRSVEDVVPEPFAQAFGAGASRRLRTLSLFSMVVPPNVAQ